MAALLAHGQTNRFPVRGQPRRAKQEVDLRQVFAALPESHFVVNGINACRALAQLIAPNQLPQIGAHLGGIEAKRYTRTPGVLFEPLPMPLKRERLALKNTQSGEESPSIKKTGLPWRKPSLFNRDDEPVVKYVAMDHVSPQLHADTHRMHDLILTHGGAASVGT